MPTQTSKFRRPIRPVVALAAGVLVASVLVVGCSSSQKVNPAPPPPTRQQLWGDMKPVVSVKELMHDLIDPIADTMICEAMLCL